MSRGPYFGRRKRSALRIVIWVFLIIAVLAVAALAALPPVITGPMIDRHVDFRRTYSAEEFGLAARKLSLTTEDGLGIVAYEVEQADPKAVIIFLSGIENPSVTAFFGHAKWLAGHGYASVLVEMRAHGESDGDRISLGYKEYLDTRAAVDYILSRDRYDGVPIVVYGLSMGAATAINSIGHIPEIDGLISLSAFSSWADAFADNMVLMGAPEWLAAAERPFAEAYCILKFGLNESRVTPENEIRRLGRRPALLMHSTGDSQVPYASFERLLASAPDHVETWVREGDYHLITTEFEQPELDKEYADTVLGFLEKHFGRES